LRLGYLVVPDSLLANFVRSNRLRHMGPATLEQRVVADFMSSGHFARHIKHMQTLYAARRQTLADGLSAVFGQSISVDLKPGGMHLIARFETDVADTKLAALAQANGLAVTPLSPRASVPAQGLLLSFTNIPEANALEVCRRLERAIGEALKTRESTPTRGQAHRAKRIR
jgi:GntR family transcriptional regulator/MocR family aminotransferase